MLCLFTALFINSQAGFTLPKSCNGLEFQSIWEKVTTSVVQLNVIVLNGKETCVVKNLEYCPSFWLAHTYTAFTPTSPTNTYTYTHAAALWLQGGRVYVLTSLYPWLFFLMCHTLFWTSPLDTFSQKKKKSRNKMNKEIATPLIASPDT